MSEKSGVDFLQGGDSSYSSLSSFRTDGHQDRPSFSLSSVIRDDHQGLHSLSSVRRDSY